MHTVSVTVTRDLTIEEITALQAAGRLPADFVAVVLPAMGGIQVHPSGQAVLVAQAPLPREVVDVPRTAVLSPDGKNAHSTKIDAAIAFPMIRVLVAREVLSPPTRAVIEAQDRAAGQASPDALPPLPALRRVPTDTDAT